MNGPVFVVGVNGSGTSMLARSLARHPDLFMLDGESRVIPYFAQRYPDEVLRNPAKRRALADELGDTRVIRRNHGQKPLRLTDAEKMPPSFSAIVDAVMMALARAQGKTLWGDKSPMYLQHIRLLSECFPGARFIHIFRDARDAAQSFHRRWKQTPQRTVYRWKHAIRLGREQGKQLDDWRYIEVRYEDLTEDPDRWMRDICDFLSLPFNDAVLQSSAPMMDKAAKTLARGKIIKNSGRWKAYFTASEVDALERICGKPLDELGYEVSQRGDDNPSEVRLAFWKMHDRFHQVAQHFAKHGLQRWSFLKLLVQDALRQDKVNRY